MLCLHALLLISPRWGLDPLLIFSPGLRPGLLITPRWGLTIGFHINKYAWSFLLSGNISSKGAQSLTRGAAPGIKKESNLSPNGA